MPARAQHRIGVAGTSLVPAPGWKASASMLPVDALFSVTEPSPKKGSYPASVTVVATPINSFLALGGYVDTVVHQLQQIHARVVSTHALTVGGKQAERIDWIVKYQRGTIRFLSTYFVEHGVAYSVTCGADKQRFEHLLGTFTRMSDSFRFTPPPDPDAQ